MVKTKKLVDLVYLNEDVTEMQLRTEYQTRLSVWNKWLQARQNDDLSSVNTFVTEQAEYNTINSFLNTFLRTRLEWVLDSISDPELRLKYLLVLPPFSQKGNIKSFLLHFFQLKDDEQQNNIVYEELTNREKEVRVLWDMYKLIKTLETIQTLKKWMIGRNPFPSQFSGEHVTSVLNNLQNSLLLLFRISIKKEFQTQMLQNFPKDFFSPESVLQRSESGEYLVTDVTLKRLVYRNYLFFIYFKSSLKANYEGQDLTFELNYLDYELIRQEFLMHWITERLGKNPQKKKVLERYMFGSKTFAQIIEHRPEMEIRLLKKLPKDVFDDLIADVNESVDEELKLPVDSMSETIGDFASLLKNYENIKNLAKQSITVLREYVGEKLRKSKSSTRGPDQNESKPEDPLSKFTPKKPDGLNFRILKKNEIGFPFFCSNNAHHIRLYKLLKAKLEPKLFNAFNSKISAYLNQVPESQLMKRQSPRHEWALPFLVDEMRDGELSKQLLILGAELKSIKPVAGSSTIVGSNYEFHCYFVYGTLEKSVEMGFTLEERKVTGEPFYIYDFSHPNVMRQALKIAEWVTQPLTEDDDEG